MIHVSGTVHIDFEADVGSDIDDDAVMIVKSLLTEKFGKHTTDIKFLETVDDDESVTPRTARLVPTEDKE